MTKPKLYSPPRFTASSPNPAARIIMSPVPSCWHLPRSLRRSPSWAGCSVLGALITRAGLQEPGRWAHPASTFRVAPGLGTVHIRRRILMEWSWGTVNIKCNQSLINIKGLQTACRPFMLLSARDILDILGWIDFRNVVPLHLLRSRC